MHYSHDENGEFKVSGSQGTLRTERRLGVGTGGDAALKGLICIFYYFYFSVLTSYFYFFVEGVGEVLFIIDRKC